MAELTRRHRNGVEVVSILGRIDATTVEDIKDEMLSVAGQRGVRLILDLSDVDYISSRGLTLLLQVLQSIQRNDGAMRLVGLQPLVREVLDIAKVAKLFTVKGSIEEATRSFE